jgi:nucleoside-diphosphate-sugar epimerase
MTSDTADIAVVGGTSRLGRALVDRLGGRARPITRRPLPGHDAIVVDDYCDVDPTMLSNVSAVINCVGAVEGPLDHLTRLNRDLPELLCKTAITAEVRHFIHISSFSVYGQSAMIDRTTRVAPNTDYGRSKLAGDQAIVRAKSEQLAVSILRLPLVYSMKTPGKLGHLLNALQRLRFWLVPQNDIERAMISVSSAADIVMRLIDRPLNGIGLAADPQPFTYELASLALPRLIRIPIPDLCTEAIRALAPGIGNRLFASSALADSDNLAIIYGLRARLGDDVVRLTRSLSQMDMHNG